MITAVKVRVKLPLYLVHLSVENKRRYLISAPVKLEN